MTTSQSSEVAVRTKFRSATECLDYLGPAAHQPAPTAQGTITVINEWCEARQNSTRAPLHGDATWRILWRYPRAIARRSESFITGCSFNCVLVMLLW